MLNESFPGKLKKSILQMAVQGKLTVQNPSDEPAAVLLERIRSEKEQLIRAGKIKRDKHVSVVFRRDNSHYEKLDRIERCIDDEIPFEIPESWEWIRFRHVITLLSGTDFKPEKCPIVKTKAEQSFCYAPKEKGGGIFSIQFSGEI